MALHTNLRNLSVDELLAEAKLIKGDHRVAELIQELAARLQEATTIITAVQNHGSSKRASAVKSITKSRFLL